MYDLTIDDYTWSRHNIVSHNILNVLNLLQ